MAHENDDELIDATLEALRKAANSRSLDPSLSHAMEAVALSNLAVNQTLREIRDLILAKP